MTKRSFIIDTTSLSTARPLLDNGFYAGTIVNASVEGKEGKQYFKIVEEKVWNKDTGTREPTGDYILSGMIVFGVVLTSKKAIKLLQQDEPRFFGNIFLRFDKETYALQDNIPLGQLLNTVGLGTTNFGEMVDFEYDDDIEVPEELETIPDIVGKLNALEFNKQLCELICQAINNQPVKAKIIKQVSQDNPDTQENVLDRGSRYAPFCGVLPYEDGCEEDLED